MGGIWGGFGCCAPLNPDPHPSPLPQERGQNVTMFIDEAAICRSPFGALFGGEMAGRARGGWGLDL